MLILDNRDSKPKTPLDRKDVKWIMAACRITTTLEPTTALFCFLALEKATALHGSRLTRSRAVHRSCLLAVDRGPSPRFSFHAGHWISHYRRRWDSCMQYCTGHIKDVTLKCLLLSSRRSTLLGLHMFSLSDLGHRGARLHLLCRNGERSRDAGSRDRNLAKGDSQPSIPLNH